MDTRHHNFNRRGGNCKINGKFKRQSQRVPCERQAVTQQRHQTDANGLVELSQLKNSNTSRWGTSDKDKGFIRPA